VHSIASEGPNHAGDEYKPSHTIVAARTLERVLLVTRNHHGFVRRHRDQVHLSAARSTPHVGNLALDDALILTESPRLYPAAFSINSLFVECGEIVSAVDLFHSTRNE
jgi:hypothetical protein